MRKSIFEAMIDGVNEANEQKKANDELAQIVTNATKLIDVLVEEYIQANSTLFQTAKKEYEKFKQTPEYLVHNSVPISKRIKNQLLTVKDKEAVLAHVIMSLVASKINLAIYQQEGV